MMGADLDNKDSVLRSAISQIQGGLQNMSMGTGTSKMDINKVPPTSSGAKGILIDKHGNKF